MKLRRLRAIASHVGYPFWLRRKKYPIASRIYGVLERFATRGDARRRDLLQWTYRETNIGWGNRTRLGDCPYEAHADDCDCQGLGGDR